MGQNRIVIVKSGSDTVGNIAKDLDTSNISNMTKQEIIDSIPNDWNYTEYNGFVHIRDAAGNICIRIEHAVEYPPNKASRELCRTQIPYFMQNVEVNELILLGQKYMEFKINIYLLYQINLQSSKQSDGLDYFNRQ